MLVTGATGFVGANLVRRLLREGCEVHVVLRPGRDLWRLDGIVGDLRRHDGSVSDRARVNEIVHETKPAWIFHLAAYGAYSQQTDMQLMIETNINGAVNLVEAAHAAGCEAFVNTGSSSEYGFKDHAPSEAEVLEPNSDYAVTKAAATLYCQSAGRRWSLPLVTLRLYSVYGPYEEPIRLVPTLIREGRRGHLPPLVRPDIARDYVYVEDVCDAYLVAAREASQHAGAVYNVGTGRQTTIREIVDVCRRLLPIADEPDWDTMGARSWDTDRWMSDPSLIKAELGWEARTDLESGLRRTLAAMP